MNNLRLALVILLAVCAQHASADSIKTFYVTQVSMGMGPNDGGGDNVFFQFTGPGLSITGSGGMECFDWCSSQGVSDAGLAATSQIFISEYFIAILGGNGYDAETLDFTSLFDFTGGVNPVAMGVVGDIQFNLLMPVNGGWRLHFDFVPPQDDNPGYYVFTGGSFNASQIAPVPEPASVSMLLTGLAGIAGVLRKKIRQGRSAENSD